MKSVKVTMLLAVAFLISVHRVTAGMHYLLKARLADSVQRKGVPFFKRPETYAISAATAVGAFFIGREIYKGLKVGLYGQRMPDCKMPNVSNGDHVKNLNRKNLSIPLVLIPLIFMQTMQADLQEIMRARITDFIRNRAIPYFKKPETYAIAAAAALGTYFVGRKIYWEMKKELPAHRVPDYVRSTVVSKVEDPKAKNRLQNLILSRKEVQDQRGTLIKKELLDHIAKQHLYDYEFDVHATVRREPDWEINEIPVIDHSAFVNSQTGLNCGYHAAFNAAHIYRLLASVGEHRGRMHRCEALRVGPPVGDWKHFVAEQTGAGRFTPNDCNALYENINDTIVRSLLTEHLKINPEDFSIIPNPSQDPARFDESLPPLIGNLQKGVKKYHLFLLGNMRDTFSVGGSGGHWIAAVVTTEGGLKVHVADSIWSNSKGRRETVGNLVQLLQINVEWARIKANMASRLESAETVLRQNNDYSNCHTRLRDIYEDIRNYDLSVREEFRRAYGSVMQLLLNRLNNCKEQLINQLLATFRHVSNLPLNRGAIEKTVEESLREMSDFLSGNDNPGDAMPSVSSRSSDSLMYAGVVASIGRFQN